MEAGLEGLARSWLLVRFSRSRSRCGGLGGEGSGTGLSAEHDNVTVCEAHKDAAREVATRETKRIWDSVILHSASHTQ